MAALVLAALTFKLNTRPMKTATNEPLLETMVCIYNGCVVTDRFKDLEMHVVAIHGITAPNQRKTKTPVKFINPIGLFVL